MAHLEKKCRFLFDPSYRLSCNQRSRGRTRTGPHGAGRRTRARRPIPENKINNVRKKQFPTKKYINSSYLWENEFFLAKTHNWKTGKGNNCRRLLATAASPINLIGKGE